ncbi:XCT protein, partial [Polypterus senegalus]
MVKLLVICPSKQEEAGSGGYTLEVSSEMLQLAAIQYAERGREKPLKHSASPWSGALCYAELGTSIKKSGGQYIYLLETLGPMPAFLRLWTQFVLIRPAASSVVALAFGRYIIEPFFSPCPAPKLLVKMVSIIGVSFGVAVNCWSVNWFTKLQIASTTIKMSALALIIVPGMIKLASGQTENFHNAFDTSSLRLAKLPLAFYAGLYAYAGW